MSLRQLMNIKIHELPYSLQDIFDAFVKLLKVINPSLLKNILKAIYLFFATINYYFDI